MASFIEKIFIENPLPKQITLEIFGMQVTTKPCSEMFLGLMPLIGMQHTSIYLKFEEEVTVTFVGYQIDQFLAYELSRASSLTSFYFGDERVVIRSKRGEALLYKIESNKDSQRSKNEFR